MLPHAYRAVRLTRSHPAERLALISRFPGSRVARSPSSVLPTLTHRRHAALPTRFVCSQTPLFLCGQREDFRSDLIRSFPVDRQTSMARVFFSPSFLTSRAVMVLLVSMYNPTDSVRRQRQTRYTYQRASIHVDRDMFQCNDLSHSGKRE